MTTDNWMHIRVGPHTVDELERIIQFLRQHYDRPGHHVAVVHDRGRQTLVCSCGSRPSRTSGANLVTSLGGLGDLIEEDIDEDD